MSIAEKQDAIIEEFSFYEEWMDKYEYIIQLGKNLPLIDEKYKTDDNIIKGCQSRVWLHATCDEKGLVHFTADSDAIITKGLISLMIEVLSGQPAADIANADIYFINKIGLTSHLSPTRSNGLLAMLKQIKLYALAFAQKNN